MRVSDVKFLFDFWDYRVGFEILNGPLFRDITWDKLIMCVLFSQERYERCLDLYLAPRKLIKKSLHKADVSNIANKLIFLLYYPLPPSPFITLSLIALILLPHILPLAFTWRKCGRMKMCNMIWKLHAFIMHVTEIVSVISLIHVIAISFLLQF